MVQNEIIRVLLAEDDDEDRMVFLEALDSLKIKTAVQTVNNGAALLKHLHDSNSVIPHLLFLDLNMPKISGLACLVEIKQMEWLKNLTIVIYSTSSSDKDIEETFLNGANIYLNKPSHFTVLKKTLLHILTINWQYHTSGLNRDNFLLHI